MVGASPSTVNENHPAFAAAAKFLQTGRQEARSPEVEYLVAISTGVAVISLVLYFRLRGLRRRDSALRELLDGADALERQLHEYRDRMTNLKRLVSRLPSDMTATAMASINPESQVRTALRDVLAHRLWIKQQGQTATQDALDLAVDALNRSRDQLANQLKLLDEVAGQLEAAGQGLRSAYQEASAAIAARSSGPNPIVDGNDTRH
jgi:hypothetical protein